MEATNHIGVVIVGAAGYRGKSALEIFPKLRAEERTKGIHLELVSVAEAKEEFRADLAVRVAALLGPPCQVVGVLAEAIPLALRWLARKRGQRKLIVYDATPAAHHYLHLMAVLPHSERERIYYFGEKPLFTEQGQIDFVERNFPRQTFFCEFIETENPAFRAANEFIHSEHLQIQRMSFWRASCIGVSIAAGDGRGGVEGGALLDKAPHDLSMSIGLVGPSSVSRWAVSQVRTHLLALHEDAFQRSRRTFLSVANTPLEDISSPARIPEQLPADALVSFDVDLTLQGSMVIPVSHIVSWVGMQETQPEHIFSDRLRSLRTGRTEWLEQEQRQVSRNRRYRYENQEIRIGLVEGQLKNRKVHLVMNLLGKFAGRRFVRLIGEGRQHEVIFEEQKKRDYHESKEADLLTVFKRVVEHCAGLSNADCVATEASLLVHKIVLNALTKANEQFHAMDQNEAYKVSALAYGKYLLPFES